MDRTVRPAGDADLEAVNAIYNHYVRTSPATFDLEERTLHQRRRWLAEHRTYRHLAYVAEAAGRIEGFATSSAWRPKAAYAGTVETSVYVAPDATGRGVGSALYRCLLDTLAGRTCIARWQE